jgi:uncharacterized membrane protein
MLRRLQTYLIALVHRATGSIGFIPTLISLGFLTLIILLLMIDSPEDDFKLLQYVPYLEIESDRTARSLITTILAGTISLIIFSFTMMMSVLNQAASNYSSKIIGSLVTRRSNQVILGFYTGTIIYTIILLIQIRDEEEFSKVPHIAVFAGIVIFFICIILFVKFINDISNSVQIYSVIERIYKQTKKRIEQHNRHLERDGSATSAEVSGLVDEWFEYPVRTSGYFQALATDTLIKAAAEHNLIIRALTTKGTYHVTGTPLFQLNRAIADQKLIDTITEGFVFYPGEKIRDNPFFGIRQLSEVAVQSLSTGLNAPGIAIACLDYLSDLLAIRMQQHWEQLLRDKAGNVRVIVPETSFADVLETCISPIRIYGKKDINLNHGLLRLMKKLAYNDQRKRYQELINRHTQAIIDDAFQALENNLDKKSMEVTIRELQRMPARYFDSLQLQY